jgi:RNA polymerase-binding transcription factor DksA
LDIAGELRRRALPHATVCRPCAAAWSRAAIRSRWIGIRRPDIAQRPGQKTK